MNVESVKKENRSLKNFRRPCRHPAKRASWIQNVPKESVRNKKEKKSTPIVENESHENAQKGADSRHQQVKRRTIRKGKKTSTAKLGVLKKFPQTRRTQKKADPRGKRGGKWKTWANLGGGNVCHVYSLPLGISKTSLKREKKIRLKTEEGERRGACLKALAIDNEEKEGSMNFKKTTLPTRTRLKGFLPEKKIPRHKI